MYGLVIHGGAYSQARDYSAQNKCLKAVLTEAYAGLSAGESALDVAVRAVMMMEDSGLFHAGRGTGRNSAGYHELDASLMEGHTRKAGAVASLRRVKNPIVAARTVMEKSPHVFMVAEGAENFLKRHAVELVDPDTYYQHDEGDGPVLQDLASDTSHGTVGAVVLDSDGHLAAATSTAGIPNKLEGRVGDTPVIGAGTFADDRIAVSCTGQGEYFLRSVAAHDVAAQCRYGQIDLADAIDQVLRDQIAPLSHNGQGWGGIIAITREGRVRMDFTSLGMHRGYVLADGVVHVDGRKDAV